MFKRNLIATAIALAFSSPALAQDAELAKIRDEIKQMKEGYERRIDALEKRLAEAEAKAGKADREEKSGAASAETAAASAPSRPASENSFNPAVSMVLQGTYASTSQDPNSYRINGFVPSGGEVGPPKRSFGLGETELAIAANIDPYFRGVAIAALAPEGGVEVEEAYFQTLALPSGFTVKGGRFFSSIGYLNEQHQHTWDFQDMPLAYKAFLGGQLRQDGLQAKWIAPTDLLVEVGAEVSSGDKFPGSDNNKNGVGGTSVFAHVGGDVGASTAWRTGLSYLRTSPRNRAYDSDVDSLGAPVVNSFSGRSRLWMADGVLKWAPNGNSTSTSFKLQGEYFRRMEDGQLTYDDTSGSNLFGPVAGAFDSRQSGWYLQGIYQFMPRWRAGYRYDRLNFGTVNNGIVQSGAGPTAADFSLLSPYSPTRDTLMLDWSPTEFSRLRFQLASDKSRQGATDNQFFVQYIYSLGAHGAHKF
ncbi:MAG TPA: TonB-dependent receptor [Burkholderiales bacterium]|nr:TonB-dependent receptor [Burkholderiales bacterium]